MSSRERSVSDGLARLRGQVSNVRMPVEGRLVRMVGLALEAKGCEAPVGSQCRVISPDGETIEAEVVGFGEDRMYLMALGQVRGIVPGSRVIPVHNTSEISVGLDLLGRVIDGAGRPLDHGEPLVLPDRIAIAGGEINPLDRGHVNRPFDVGIRAINGLLTVGEGQRLGLFAGSGVGKSSLLAAITRNAEADVVVVALIGERGREVKGFVEHTLAEAGMARAVVVATPADATPLMRIRGALRATAIAEYFRSRGLRVLLLMDSLTRFAQAQREIAVSIGEFPVAKGYPPSVFTMLPQLIERAGNSGNGSITALYTVLVEGDDPSDPIADAARAILDGHIVLSRTMAEAGVYPAISIEASISRCMSDLVAPDHLAQSITFRQLLATYQQNSDLITVGAYSTGTDQAVDRAINAHPALLRYIRQAPNESVSLADSKAALAEIVASHAS